MKNIFYFNRDGKKEEVELEKWIWAVVYNDNTELHQFDFNGDEGVFHQIGEVKQDEVKLFVLLEVETGRRIDIIPPKGARLIHKYKHYILDNGKRHEKIYAFGYKIGDHYHFNFVMPSGTIIQSTEDGEQLSNFGL